MTATICPRLKGLLISGIMAFSLTTQAQTERIEPISFGDMDKWMVRIVDESFVIGGATKYLYEISSGDTMRDNTPYTHYISPWATSTVMAKVSGVTKASITVFPERRGNGQCARLETRLEKVKVLGLLNLSVIATGTIYLGTVNEPITDTKNPQSKLNMGIPFTKTPKAVLYDFKVTPGGKQVKATGFGSPTEMTEQNNAEVGLYLQRRWEDANGNIYARRIATAYERYDKNVTEWQNNHRLDVHYGDITREPFFKPYMNIVSPETPQYCLNSKGVSVPIHELGWAAPGEKPTHLILRFSSGHGGAYIGAPDSKFWIDNVRLVY